LRLVPILSWLLFQPIAGIAISNGYKLYAEKLMQTVIDVNLKDKSFGVGL